MPWHNDQAKRDRDAAVYGDPEYKRNAAIILAQAGGRYGRCASCGRRRRLQVDHIRNVAQHGIDHSLANLQALCCGPGSCHAAKTAAEGGGRRAGDAPFTPTLSQW